MRRGGFSVFPLPRNIQNGALSNLHLQDCLVPAFSRIHHMSRGLVPLKRTIIPLMRFPTPIWVTRSPLSEELSNLYQDCQRQTQHQQDRGILLLPPVARLRRIFQPARILDGDYLSPGRTRSGARNLYGLGYCHGCGEGCGLPGWGASAWGRAEGPSGRVGWAMVSDIHLGPSAPGREQAFALYLQPAGPPWPVPVTATGRPELPYHLPSFPLVVTPAPRDGHAPGPSTPTHQSVWCGHPCTWHRQSRSAHRRSLPRVASSRAWAEKTLGAGQLQVAQTKGDGGQCPAVAVNTVCLMSCSALL